jgi:hypothetical protein
MKTYPLIMMLLLLTVTAISAATPAVAGPALSEVVFYVH